MSLMNSVKKLSLTHNQRIRTHNTIHGGALQYSSPEHKKLVNIPAYQYYVKLGYNNFYLVPCNPLSTTALSSTNKINFDIDEAVVPQQFGDPFFLFDITCSTASVTCLPLPYVFDRSRLLQLPDIEIAKWYPPNVLAFIYMTSSKEDLKLWSNMMGFHLSESGQNQKLLPNLIFNTSDVNRLLFLPIPSGFCHMGGFDMVHLKKIRFELQVDSANFVTSGSASNLTLNNLYLVFPTKEVPSFDRQLTINSEKSGPHVYQYLDFDYIPFNSQALNASSAVTFVLDQFNHKSAFLLIHILGNAAPSGTQLIDTYDIGDLGRFDILNEVKKSIYAQSSALYESQVYQQFSDMVDKLCLRGWYFLPFTSDLKSAWNGSLDEGFFQFPGTKLLLQLTFPGNSTQEVTTFTLTNSANNSGFYRFFASNKLNGETDIGNSLAYNANTTTMASSISGLYPIAKQGFTPTASAAASGGTFTVTWGNRDGRVSDNISFNMICDSLNDSGTAEATAVTTSTYGKRGWTTLSSGSNVVNIYSFYFKKCTVNENGVVVIENV